MSDANPPHNLEQMLDQLKEGAADHEQVTIGDMLETVGRRSFGPILLLAGLIPASPLSGIPGVPTFISILVFLVTVQLLFGHRQFWLPQWLLKRHVGRNKYLRALQFLRPPARWIDRLIHPRLHRLVEGPAVYGIALICLLIAVFTPPLELVPFASTGSGMALSIFGLALIALDGALVLVGVALTLITLGLIATTLL